MFKIFRIALVVVLFLIVGLTFTFPGLCDENIQPVAVLEGHTRYVYSVAFSPDGKLLASGSWDRTIKFWDVASRQCVATLVVYTRLVNSVAFSPDGKLLAFGSNDKTIELWDVESRECIALLKGHTNEVECIAFSPDGGLLASASWDRTIKLWDVASRQCVATIRIATLREDVVYSVAFSQDGKLLASGHFDETVKLWSVENGEHIVTLKGHKDPVSSVAFSPHGKLLASGSWDDTIKLWDVESRKDVATLRGHKHSVYSVAFSQDGRLLASGSGDEIKLWDVGSRDCVASFKGQYTDFVHSLAFSPDGKLLASGCDDPLIPLWDVTSFTPTNQLPVILFAKAVDLWFPGGVDSYWIYDEPAGIGAVVTGENVEINGRLYKIVEHTRSSSISLFPGLEFDPFFTFRKDRPDRVVGYGVAVNEWMKKTIKEPFIAAGFPERVISVVPTSDEWVILETPAIGHEWTVVKLDVKAASSGASVSGVFEIRGRVDREEPIKIRNEELQTVVVAYTQIEEVAGKKGEKLVYTVWLAPNIGPVQFKIGENVTTIDVYQITPTANQPPFVSFTSKPFGRGENVELTFDASASHDSDGQITSYEWDFGDGSTGKGKVVKHSYPSEGQYTVTLKVTDNKGGASTASIKVTLVAAPKPEAKYTLAKVAGKEKGGVLVPSKFFPEGKDNVIPLYVPSLVGGSNLVRNEGGWKTIKEIVQRDISFEGKEVVAHLAFSGADTPAGAALSAIADLIKAYQQAIYIYECKMSIQADANNNFRAAMELGDPDRRTFLRSYAGKGWTDPLAKSFWLVQAVCSQQIAAMFGLPPDDFPSVYYTMLVRADDLHKADSYIGYVSLSKEGKILITPKVYPNDGLQIIKVHQFIVPLKKETVVDLAGEKLISFLEGPATPGFIKMLSPFLTSGPATVVQGRSPIELRIYDIYNDQQQVTGLVNGEVKEEILNSIYDQQHKIVLVFSAANDYRYEVEGTTEGDYELEVAFVEQEDVEPKTFLATKIPISTKAVHQYTIDWTALSEGKEGVGIWIDKQGDGMVEKTLVSDGKLTRDEYLSVVAVTPQGKYPFTWGEIRQTKLFQNYPNPFNPETWIPYQLAEKSQVVIWIYNITGGLVRKLELGEKLAGVYLSREEATYWDGCDENGEPVASGVYFYTLRAGDFTDTKKMVILQ